MVLSPLTVAIGKLCWEGTEGPLKVKGPGAWAASVWGADQEKLRSTEVVFRLCFLNCGKKHIYHLDHF